MNHSTELHYLPDPKEIERKISPGQLLGNIAKNIFDFCLAFIGLICLSPIFLVLAFLIKHDSPGPVFYWGPRVGKNGKPFKILKFRTMFEQPESYEGPVVTCKDDGRITPFGRWLRDTKLNELPQLWNVLIGEMSIVGPRPECPEVVEDWPEDARKEILSVRVGITSPASILYHDEESLLHKDELMDEYLKRILPDKMRLDRLYVRNHSFISDLDVIFWTAVILLPRLTAKNIPEVSFFVGPFFRLFNRYLSWFVTDLITAILAAAVCGLFWRALGPLNWGIQYLAVMVLALALLFSGINSIVGLNRIVWSKAVPSDAMGLVISGGMVSFFITTLNFVQNRHHFLGMPSLPSSMILMIGLLSTMGFVVNRYRFRLMTGLASRWLNWRQNSTVVGERVLIVGGDENDQFATWLLSHQYFRSFFSIEGMVKEDDIRHYGMKVNGCWVLGGLKDIPGIIQKYNISMLMFSLPNADVEVREYVSEICGAFNVRLVVLNEILRTVNIQLSQEMPEHRRLLWENGFDPMMEMYDPLTGLPSRLLFQDRLRTSIEHSRRYKTQQALLFINLEGLHEIQDQKGARYADEALKIVASSLCVYKRKTDTLARFGGFEFAMILEDVADSWGVEVATKRLMSSISRKVIVDGTEFPTQPSLSISYVGRDGDDSSSEVADDLNRVYKNRRVVEGISCNDNVLAK